MGRFADHEFDVELKVGNLLEIALEHGAIAGEAEWPAVVARVVGDELTQIRPILPIQAGDIAAVEVGEMRLRSWRRFRVKTQLACAETTAWAESG